MSNTETNNTEPLVSIVIPMLNEVEAIERCIRSILDQDYPIDKIEIVVVDGMSTDGSRGKVNELARQYGHIKLYDNEKRRTPVALNIGARNASGEVVIILGAHTRIDKYFVSTNIKYMNELGVKCTGGTQKNVGDTYLQRAVGYGMGSAFGMPSAPYRFFPKKRFVDTVVYAAYRKELFDEIGYFDEELHISEDAEFNWRIRQAGHKIFYTPEIVSYYYPRKNLRGLFRQFFNYGILRVNVIKKHFDAFKLIHALPPIFILAVLILSVLSFAKPVYGSIMLGLIALYLIYLLIGSLGTVIKLKKLSYFPILPFVFLTMQISWGLGFIVGVFKTYK